MVRRPGLDHGSAQTEQAVRKPIVLRSGITELQLVLEFVPVGAILVDVEVQDAGEPVQLAAPIPAGSTTWSRRSSERPVSTFPTQTCAPEVPLHPP